MPSIELIARAIIKKDDMFLVAKQKTESNTFLPGGHIEEGEYAKEALRRELFEELGVQAEIGGFVGVLEHKFTDRHGKKYEEINLIFEVVIPESELESIEDHLEFQWVRQNEFTEKNLLPSSLQVIIPKWVWSKTPFHHCQDD